MAFVTGENSLQELVRTMKPALSAEEYVYCSVDPETASRLGLQPVCVFREGEGETLILPRAEAARCGLPFIYPCRLITLTVHSSLEAVGFLARISAELARHGISVNAVSAYYHDHLFVPVARAAEALKILQALSLGE